MKLYENPETIRQRKMLKSEKLGRYGEAKKEVIHQLDKSIRYLHHILQQTYNLTDEICDKINALTMVEFLQNSLRIKKTKTWDPYAYDFRTVELARLFFEISADYLKQNPYLKPDDEIPKNIQNSISDVSDFFKMLSNDVLQREPNKPIDKEETILRGQLHSLEEKYHEFDTNWNDLVKEKKKTDDIGSRQMLSKEIDMKEFQRNLVYKLQSRCKLKLLKKNLQKYNHPDKVYCPINPLKNFFISHNPHLDDTLQKT